MKKTGKLLAALITALSLAMPVNVWADTKISSISLKIDSSIEAGDSSNDVEYKEVDGDDCAYVKASYFIKEGNAYSRTYQMYVLRKDADGNWKILVFYQVNGDSSDDE